MVMKRFVDGPNVGKCLNLLLPQKRSRTQRNSNVFQCKTCNREFDSFQALGGHRASHKKPRPLDANNARIVLSLALKKPKMHRCSICGTEFCGGQALGGHMRRHRDRAAMDGQDLSPPSASHSQVPVLKRSNSSRRVRLDLNLTPLENDLQFLFGKNAPEVDPFI